MILLLMENWYGERIDVKGEFLMRKFDNSEIMYPEITEGFKKFYPSNVVLLLLLTMYGLREAAKMYWITTPEAMYHIHFKIRKVDPSL